MKFFLLEIVTNDEGKATPGVYSFDKLDDAKANYHTKLGGAMKSKAYASIQLMVFNSENGIYPDLQDKWVRPVEEVTE